MNLKKTRWKFERAMETIRKTNWRKFKRWKKRIIEQFNEKHEDIWKKLTRNLRYVCEKYEKDLRET